MGGTLQHSFGSGKTKASVVVIGEGANASADLTIFKLSYTVPGANAGKSGITSGFDVDLHYKVGGSVEFSGRDNGWDFTFKLGVGVGAMWKGVEVNTDVGD